MDDLSRAQERLGKALGRARVGEDRELANVVRELGERLAHLLSGLLRMSRLHSPDNRAFDQPVAELHTTLARLEELLGSIHLVAVEDQVYVNDIRIRADEKATSLRELSQELQQHNVGGLTFHTALGDGAIRALIGALGAAPAPREPRTALAHALVAAGIEGVELQGRYRFRMAGEAVAEQLATREAREVVTRVIAAVDEAFQNLAAGRVPNPLPLRRLVSELLRHDLGAEELWLDPEDTSPWALHAFRVGHLSLVVGSALGLPEGVLQDLGVAALYHDAGYAAPEVQRGEAGAAFAAHVAAGARLMLRQRGFHEAKARRVLALLHHHRDASDSDAQPSLFARILRVAEDYDTLARRSGKLSPTMALALMRKWAGTRYDPVVFQLFLNTLGAYPPGTLLQLPDGRAVRSASLVRSPDSFAAPLGRCLRLAGGAPAPADLPLVETKGLGKLQLLAPG